MSTFEDRLWSDLVSEHGSRMRTHFGPIRSARRHRPALLTGSALAAAAVIAAAVLAFRAGTGAPPAYAVTTEPDGTVAVTLNEISAISGLNAELAQDGLRAKAVPVTAGCPTRAFQNAMPAGTNPSTYTITIVPADIPAGYTAIVAVAQNAAGQVTLTQGAWPNPGPSCISTQPILIPEYR